MKKSANNALVWDAPDVAPLTSVVTVRPSEPIWGSGLET